MARFLVYKGGKGRRKLIGRFNDIVRLVEWSKKLSYENVKNAFVRTDKNESWL